MPRKSIAPQPPFGEKLMRRAIAEGAFDSEASLNAWIEECPALSSAMRTLLVALRERKPLQPKKDDPNAF